MDEYIEGVGAASGADIRAPALAGPPHSGRRIDAEACFTALHPGFQGHFPSRPLLPGFLQLQVVLDVLSLLGGSIDVAAVHEAKFLRPIRPEERLQIAIEIHPGRIIHADIHVGGAPASVLELELSGDWPSAAPTSQNR